MTDVLAKHAELLEAVRAEDYYLHIVNQIAEKWEGKVKSAQDVCSFWNDVWYRLPDTPSIRRSPFFEVCDLAEGEYLEEQENE